MNKIDEISFKSKVDDLLQMSHLNQKRYDGTAYVVHPIRVKNRLGNKVGNNYTDEELVSLFHDSIENAKTEKKKSRILEKIKSLFRTRPNVIDAIVYLTREESDYIKYMTHIFIEKLPNTKAQEIAKKVKINDIMDNAIDNPKKVQYLKYKNAIRVMQNLGAEFPNELLSLFNKDLYLEYIISEAEPKPTDTPPADDAGAGDPPTDDANTDTPPADAGGENPFGDVGGDSGGGSGDMGGNPFGDAGGGGGDMGAGGDAGGGMGGDTPADGATGEPSEEEKKKILYYSDKLNKIKTLKYQRNAEEPGMDFAHFNDFIKSNYISMTKNGSLMLPASDDIKTSKLFLDKVVIPYVKKYVDNYTENNKKFTVLTNVNDDVIKYINSRGGVQLKTTNFSNQYSDDIYKDVKQKTESDESAIKAAMYLYNITSGKKLKREGGEIDDVLTKWGVGPTASQQDIVKVVYPEQFNQVQNEASFIIKVYLYSLRKEFIKRVLQNETKGLRTIAIVDKYTAWMLNTTFKNSDKIIKDVIDKKKEAKQQEVDAQSNKDIKQNDNVQNDAQSNKTDEKSDEKVPNVQDNAESGNETPEKETSPKKEKPSEKKSNKSKPPKDDVTSKIPNPFAP